MTSVLFGYFVAIWPKAWADVVSSTDERLLFGEWSRAIRGMSKEQLRRGVDACRDNCTWPPSMAEFRQMATGQGNREQRALYGRIHAEDAERKALPAKTWADQREIGKRHLRELMASLMLDAAP